MDTVIREGLNGQLVANGDATLLATAIDRVASRSAARSAAAIRQTVQEFAWPHIATAIIKEYEKTLASRTLRPE
jgi:glycosyltransferase involved in cell wall biosynthesis